MNYLQNKYIMFAMNNNFNINNNYPSFISDQLNTDPSLGSMGRKVTKNITAACKQKIAELKDKKEKILPKKLNLKRLNLIGLASFASMIAGAILALIGISFCIGGFLPAGICMTIGGAALAITSSLFLKYYIQKMIQWNAVKRIEAKIAVLKKMIKEPVFKKYVGHFRQELGIKYLSSAELAIKCDIKRLYNLHQMAENARLKKPRKRDPQVPIYLDYTDDFNLLAEKMQIANKLLEKINREVRTIESAIKKSRADKAAHLNKRKEIHLQRAMQLKNARIQILNRTPDADEMSSRSFDRFRKLKKASKRCFSSLK